MQYYISILLAAACLYGVVKYIRRKRIERINWNKVHFTYKTAPIKESTDNPICVLKGDGSCCMNGTDRQHIKHSNESIRFFDESSENPFEDRFEIHLCKRN